MICTHCSATVSTCKGYLVQVNPDGTLPLVYACAPSCQGFPRAQGLLFPPEPPARSLWRDRHTDPPEPPGDAGRAATAILVMLNEDLLLGFRFTPMVLSWWPQHRAWLDIEGSVRDWTLWQPIDLPAYVPQQAGQDSGGA